MPSSDLRDFLIAHGYAITLRVDGFVTALASMGDERWLGNGPDEDTALRDLVRQMFPSAAAWKLLEQALKGAVAPTTPEPGGLPDAEPQPEPPPPPREEANGPLEPDVEVDPAMPGPPPPVAVEPISGPDATGDPDGFEDGENHEAGAGLDDGEVTEAGDHATAEPTNEAGGLPDGDEDGRWCKDRPCGGGSPPAPEFRPSRSARSAASQVRSSG